ncbi:MAG: secretin N-terminal domain-containing protein, partial [Candidatus Elarobacter sp.]
MRRTPGWLGMTVLSLCLGVPCAAVPAASAPNPHVQRRPADAPQVLPVTNIPAGRAAGLLRRLFPGARIVDDAKTNTLVVIAAPDTVGAIRAVLAGIDVKNPLAPVTEAIPLQRSDPVALAARLRTVYRGARIEVAPRRTLVVTTTPQELALIRSLVAALDAPPSPAPVASSAPVQTEAVRVTQARAHDVAREIAGAFRAVRARVAGSSVVLTGSPDDVAKAKGLVAVLDQPPAGTRYTQIYRLHYLDAASVGDLMRRSFPAAAVDVETDLNAISVVATTAEHRRITDALAQLDVGFAQGAGAAPLAQPGESATVGGGQIEVYTLRAALPGLNGSPSTSAANIAQTIGAALGQLAPDLHV